MFLRAYVRTMQIRRGKLDDLDVIAKYNIDLAGESEGLILEEHTAREGALQALRDESRGSYFVAEEGGKIIGQLMLTKEWSDWRNGWIWWIQSVYVKPEFREKGVFRALYEYVKEVAKNAEDVVGIRLYAYKDNKRAHKVYESLGMTGGDNIVFEEMPL